MKAYVKPIHIIPLSDEKLLILSPNFSSVIQDQKQQAFIQKLADNKDALIDINMLFSEHPDLEGQRQRLIDAFLEPMSETDQEIAKIEIYGPDCEELTLLKKDPIVSRLNRDQESWAKRPVLHVGHFRTFDLAGIGKVEAAAGEQDIVLISTLLRNMHIVVGPICRAYGTPTFRDFFDNWQLFENNRLNQNRSWFSVIDFAIKEQIALPPIFEVSGPRSGIVAFHLNKVLHKLIGAPAPHFFWDEAFGISFCDLQTGETYVDSLIHALTQDRGEMGAGA